VICCRRNEKNLETNRVRQKIPLRLKRATVVFGTLPTHSAGQEKTVETASGCLPRPINMKEMNSAWQLSTLDQSPVQSPKCRSWAKSNNTAGRIVAAYEKIMGHKQVVEISPPHPHNKKTFPHPVRQNPRDGRPTSAMITARQPHLHEPRETGRIEPVRGRIEKSQEPGR